MFVFIWYYVDNIFIIGRVIIMNIWHDMPKDRIKSNDFTAVIEIPKGSKAKYEMDKATGMLKLDRVLYTSTHYPANYGFIPLTYGFDNDPLDVLVLCSEAIGSMTLVRCYPIGVIIMEDQGYKDEKVIAIPFDDPMYNNYQNINELPQHMFDEMSHFFTVYKTLEGKETALIGIKGKDEAIRLIEECIEGYKIHFNK